MNVWFALARLSLILILGLAVGASESAVAADIELSLEDTFGDPHSVHALPGDSFDVNVVLGQEARDSFGNDRVAIRADLEAAAVRFHERQSLSAVPQAMPIL